MRAMKELSRDEPKLLGRRDRRWSCPSACAGIEQQQDRSEILIGGSSLAWSSSCSPPILYAVSPKPMTEFALEPFAWEPWAIYLVLTVIRLIWASAPGCRPGRSSCRSSSTSPR